MGDFSILGARFSPEYFRRIEMMKSLELPTISETNDLLDVPLSTIVFEQCHPELREDYGLSPYLKGPQGDLWVSPDDLLAGKIVLSPPPTEKHMSALSHQAVIDLGAKVDQRLENEMRIAKETAIRELEQFLSSVFEVEKAELIAALRKEEELKYGSQLTEIKTFYENKICQILWECYEEVGGLEEHTKSEIDAMNKRWRERVEQEIQNTTTRLTEEFLEKMKLQEGVLVSIFDSHIRVIKEKKRCAIDFQRTICSEKIQEMMHRLRCKNVADLMYLLCKERRKCKRHKKEMRKHYLECVRQLKSTSKQKSNEIKNLIKLKHKRIRQIKVRERCLIEILSQYQKFIYFALKAVPTQGEFLLNIKQLLKFELEDYCLRKEVSETVIKDQEETRILTEKDLFDYDQQIEEFLEYPHSEEEEEGCSDVLPALYYNNKMYVREDFRDMFSAGLQINRYNPSWNPDVEELLNIFRKNCEIRRDTCQIEKVTSHVSSKGNLTAASDDSRSTQIQTFSPDPSPPTTPRSPSPLILQPPIRLSSMTSQSDKKKSFQNDQEEKEIRKISLAEPENKVKKPSRPSRQISRTQNLGTNSTQSRLTLARDSVILTLTSIERKSLQGFSRSENEDYEAELTEVVEDEIGYEDATVSLELEQPETKPTTSKLLLACDSVELIRSKLDIIPAKEKSPQKGERRKSQLTFSPQVSVDAAAAVVQYPLPPKTPKKGKPGKSAKRLLLGSRKVSPGAKKISPVRKPVKVTPKTTAPVTPRSVTKGKVAGAKGKEQVPPIQEFTKERITGLVHMMTENPSLIRLFTSCRQ